MSTAHSSTLAPAGIAMWWDGGERAITAREKARIEEHGPSCFSIALVPATPCARWAADGLPDPHAGRYACERAALTLGNLTDDEVANAVYLHGNEHPSMADLVAGKALSGIVYLTAAKDRIRWLSRALEATCKQPLQVGEVQGDARSLAEHVTDHLCHHEYDIGGRSELLACVTEALAARQPGAPVRFAGALEETRVRDLRESFDVAHQAFAHPAARIPSDEWGGRKDMMCPDDEDDGLDFNRSSWSAEVIASGPLGVRPEDSIVLTASAAAAIQQVLMELLQAATAAPPAQGIDLGQLERIRNELHAMSGQVPNEWIDPIVELQQDVQKLIDGQRDAAPGVRISQGTHDPSGVGNG